MESHCVGSSNYGGGSNHGSGGSHHGSGGSHHGSGCSGDFLLIFLAVENKYKLGFLIKIILQQNK